jgi:cyclase
MRKVILLCLLALYPLTASAQRNFDNVEIKATKVAGSVYMLTGAGGNIGVSVGDDGIVIVDDQFAPLAPKIREALRGITTKPFRFVVNTHFHGDHTGGNTVFGREAPIVAHENVRKRLRTGSGQTPPAPAEALPIITFDANMMIHLNGEDIRASHFPHGHTDGDSVIYFTQSNVVHMGDHFFNGMFPFIDLASGGTVRGLIANVEYVLATLPPDAKIIPGHGPLGDKAALQRYVDMLHGTSAAVRQAIAAGKTVEQAKADKILAEWQSFNWQFISTEAFIETLYAEYGK